MGGQLILLRLIGALFGAGLSAWSFRRFRVHAVRRHEFFLSFSLGLAFLLVSIYPDSLNILAGMLSLSGKEYGRLILLLIISNMVMWLLILSLRTKDTRKSIQFDLLVRRLAYDRFDAAEWGPKAAREIMVVIPALDEAENLQQVLPRIPKEILGHAVDVLVVDDGSTDSTAEMVRKLGHRVVSNPINRGGGASLRLAYDIANAGGASIVVTMDADGQHLPEEISRLVEPVLNDQLDFVIGSRVLGEREKDSKIRWIGVHVFDFLINLLAGTNITDCSSGFRAFRIECLKKVLLLQDQFHTAEMIIDAARNHVRIGEVPITIKRRLSGSSKKGRNLTYGLNFARSVFKSWWR
jgi:cellulose synthase/poly-beta-1,6-N-acetylglucosamine synthase-like glycosyltransferase